LTFQSDIINDVGAKSPAKPDSVNKINCVIDPWEKIVPFTGSDNLPDFPLKVFPGWLGDFINAESIATQTPTGLAGMLVLSALGTSLAKKAEVELRHGWREPLNIWTVISLPPGNRKSAVFRDVTNPILQWENEERMRILPDVKQAENERKIMEGQILKLHQIAIKTKDPMESQLSSQEATNLAIKLEQTVQVVVPRLIMDDATPEALAKIMFEQGGRIAVMSAEGGLFDTMSGRYSQSGSANIDVYLKGHAGDMLRVERIGREANFIDKPALTLGLSVQPNVLEGLVDKHGLRGRGLLARFLYSIPRSTVGNRDLNACSVSDNIRSIYSDGIKKLLNTSIPQEPYILKLSPDAEEVFRNFEEQLEPQLRPFGELYSIVDWASKLAGAVGRIMGQIHVAKHILTREPWNILIDRSTAEGVIQLANDYLIPHANAAFGFMGADEQQEKAKHLLRWIERKGLTEFTKRQAHYELQGTFKRADELDRPIRILMDRNFIRERQVLNSEKQVGRKPSQTFEVNPGITQLTKLTQLDKEISSVDCVNSIMNHESINNNRECPDSPMGGVRKNSSEQSKQNSLDFDSLDFDLL